MYHRFSEKEIAHIGNLYIKILLTEPVRQHEELDGLWECGIKNYPVKGTFEDLYYLSLEKAKSQYVYDDIISYSTECIRKFKPLVCV